MTASARQPLVPPESSGGSLPLRLESVPADTFGSGARFTHGDGTIVQFHDPRWVISTDPLRSITFDRIPEWLSEPLRRYIALLWLDDGMSISYITQTMSAARWLVRTLQSFTGKSMASLTPDHARRVRRKLEAEADAARAALESAERTAGRTLTDRERREAVRGVGRMAPAMIVRTIRGICAVAEAWLGTPLHFRLDSVDAPADDPRGPASASAYKVLSPPDRAALRRVLDAELRRYTDTRDMCWNLMRGANFARLAGAVAAEEAAAADPYATRRGGRPVDQRCARALLDSYFGLNGERMRSQDELCRVLHRSPTSGGTLGRQAKKYLGRFMSAKDASRVLALRAEVMSHRVTRGVAPTHPCRQGDPAYQEMLAILSRAGVVDGPVPATDYAQRGRPSVAQPATEAAMDREKHALRSFVGLDDEAYAPAAELARIWGLADRDRAMRRVKRHLVLLFGAETAGRILRARQDIEHLRSRAIKAQAVKLQIAVARRVSELVEIPAQPYLVEHEVADEKVVEISFHMGKGWGDSGAEQGVPCPGELADIALSAIATAQALRAPIAAALLRDFARTGDDAAQALAAPTGPLFLIPDPMGGPTVALSSKVLQEYVYTNQPGKDGGLLQRCRDELSELHGFSLHHIRHTNASHMHAAGASGVTVAKYLGHNFTPDNTTQAVRFYIAGGTAVMRERTKLDIEAGRARGYLMDAVSRLAIETLPEAARDDAVRQFPDQLSFEDAIDRIRDHNILVQIPETAAEAARLLSEDGVYLNLTAWGACLLPAEDGPCPAGGHDCSFGLAPDSDHVAAGCGCLFQALTPAAEDQLALDIEVLEAQLEAAATPEFAALSRHIRQQLAVKHSQLTRARELTDPRPPHAGRAPLPLYRG